MGHRTVPILHPLDCACTIVEGVRYDDFQNIIPGTQQWPNIEREGLGNELSDIDAIRPDVICIFHLSQIENHSPSMIEIVLRYQNSGSCTRHRIRL